MRQTTDIICDLDNVKARIGELNRQKNDLMKELIEAAAAKFEKEMNVKRGNPIKTEVGGTTLFYSCQSTVEEEIDRERRRAEKGMKTHAERLAEMDAEIEERLSQNERPDGLVVKLRDKDGNIDIETSWPKAQLADYLPFVKDQMADCFMSFDEFRKKHPEFHEMHFMTEHTVWEKDLDEEEGE